MLRENKSRCLPDASNKFLKDNVCLNRWVLSVLYSMTTQSWLNLNKVSQTFSTPLHWVVLPTLRLRCPSYSQEIDIRYLVVFKPLFKYSKHFQQSYSWVNWNVIHKSTLSNRCMWEKHRVPLAVNALLSSLVLS